MAHARGLLKGPKFNGRHSTVIPSAIPAVEAARDCPHVSKIALGVITPIRAAEEHLKFTPVSGGLKMQVRGSHAVQIFWLYTTRPDDTIAEIAMAAAFGLAAPTTTIVSRPGARSSRTACTTLTVAFEAFTRGGHFKKAKGPEVNLVSLSHANYGGNAGIWRILDVLERNKVRATVDVNGLAVQKWPDAVKALHQAGNEIAGHGTTNDIQMTDQQDRLVLTGPVIAQDEIFLAIVRPIDDDVVPGKARLAKPSRHRFGGSRDIADRVRRIDFDELLKNLTSQRIRRSVLCVTVAAGDQN